MEPRILLAEDERSLAAIFAKVLRGAGYSVDVALDGGSALALFREHEYDAVITDYRLPKADGLSLLDAVRDSAPFTPVIVLSGYDDVPLRANRASDPVVVTLRKPIAMPDLIEVIRRLLRTSEQLKVGTA